VRSFQRLAMFTRGLALTAWLAPALAQAQVFPTRPIHMVIAFPPGGPTDFVGRLLAEKMKDILGQSVIIENKAGANGALGADYVAKAEPDGHTVFLTTAGAVAITPNMRTDLPYDSQRDFAPITLVTRNSSILVVNAEAKINSARELATLAQEKPATIPFGSTGIGSMPHLALELYQAAGKVKFLHVPYRGAAPMITDLLGGQIQALFADPPVLMPQIQGGKLRPLAAAAGQRLEVLPNVPTLAEQGFANTVADNWYGLFVPVRTPRPVQAKLHDAVIAALTDPVIRGKLLASGALPSPTSAEELGEFLRMELAKWGRVVRENNIKE
jgi:tripartite-type tricarboxylate transporter receptor subunit TctC